jgi:hypothetical protein
MSQNEDGRRGLTRREFLETAGLTTLASGLGTGALEGCSAMVNAKDVQTPAKAPGSAEGKPHNILFILTDQERCFDSFILPDGYSLPGRKRSQAVRAVRDSAS